jgi:hypothetical protein
MACESSTKKYESTFQNTNNLSRTITLSLKIGWRQEKLDASHFQPWYEEIDMDQKISSHLGIKSKKQIIPIVCKGIHFN